MSVTSETHTEIHILSLDYIDAEVHIEADGSVGIYFKPIEGNTIKVDSRDLARIVAFAEQHGQVTLTDKEY